MLILGFMSLWFKFNITLALVQVNGKNLQKDWCLTLFCHRETLTHAYWIFSPACLG